MKQYRVALRLARREVLRRPGRTLLVALLIALPVAGMTSAAVLIRSDHQSLDEEWQQYYGQADAAYSVWVGEGLPAEDTAAPELPPGSRTISVTSGYTAVRTADRVHRAGGVEVSDAPLSDALTYRAIELVDGRAPSAAGEVVLSRSLLRKLHGRVGEELELDSPAGPLVVQVVGRVEQPSCLGCDHLIVRRGAVPDVTRSTSGEQVLVDLPDDLTTEQVGALAAQERMQVRALYGEDYGPRYGRDDGTEGVRWSLVVGAVVLTVMGIVIAAAFAVGARRQLVVLGQLSASGAAPATVRASLFLQGTVTGIVGSVGGVVLGLGALVLFHGRVEELMGRRIDDLPIRPSDVVAAMVVGIVAATLAALIPARSATKVSTLAALAGRKPQSKVPARVVAAGMVAVVGGLAFQAIAVIGGSSEHDGNLWAAIAIIGGIGELLGACAIAPVIVARLEPLAGRLRGSWRIGARSLARSRTRTGAVVSAIAAAGALAILSISLVRGNELQDPDHLEVADDVVVASIQVSEQIDPELGIYTNRREVPPPSIADDLASILPGASRADLRSVVFPQADPPKADEMNAWALDPVGPSPDPFFSGGIGVSEALVADAPVVEAAGLTDAGREALDEHGLVLIGVEPGPDAVLRPPGERAQVAGTEPILVPRVEAAHGLTNRGEELLVTPAKASELGLEMTVGGYLYAHPEGLTEVQRDSVDDLYLDLMYEQELAHTETTSRYIELGMFRPDTGISPLQVELILSGIALVFALFVVGVSLGLAAAESKDERDVLTVAGAPPSALARSAGARAFLMSVLGGAMAVPVGFLPVLVYARAETDGFVLTFPGTIVSLLLLAVPAIVGLLAYGTSATAQRLRPVRVSTATWD